MTPRPRPDIPTIAARLAAHDPTPIPVRDAPRRAAVAIILRAPDTARGTAPDAPSGGESGPVEALFIRRVEHPDDPWSGHIAFPGGHVDATDEDAIAGAVREAREEVGIDLDRDARLLGQLDDVRSRARGRLLKMAITPAVFALERPVSLRPEPAEVAEAFWLPLAPFVNGAHASTLLYDLPEHGEVALPCWRVEGHCIWGLTYHMTCALLAVLGQRVPPDVGAAAPPSSRRRHA